MDAVDGEKETMYVMFESWMNRMADSESSGTSSGIAIWIWDGVGKKKKTGSD